MIWTWEGRDNNQLNNSVSNLLGLFARRNHTAQRSLALSRSASSTCLLSWGLPGQNLTGNWYRFRTKEIEYITSAALTLRVLGKLNPCSGAETLWHRDPLSPSPGSAKSRRRRVPAEASPGSADLLLLRVACYGIEAAAAAKLGKSGDTVSLRQRVPAASSPGGGESGRTLQVPAAAQSQSGGEPGQRLFSAAASNSDLCWDLLRNFAWQVFGGLSFIIFRSWSTS